MATCPKCGAEIGVATSCEKCGFGLQLSGFDQEYWPDPPVYPDPPPYEGQQQYQGPPPPYQGQQQYQGSPPPYQGQQYQGPPQYSYPGEGMYPRYPQNDGLFTAAFVLMILGTIGLALATFGIALAWGIPMTIHAYKIRKGDSPNTVAFGVCSLLFVGIIAGVLLLVAPKDE